MFFQKLKALFFLGKQFKNSKKKTCFPQSSTLNGHNTKHKSDNNNIYKSKWHNNIIEGHELNE